MSDANRAFEVVVPPQLASAWAALAPADHTRLSARLERAARRASTHPTVWPAGPAGIHRGKHRAVIDELWMLYGLDDQARTVSLIGFGHLPPRVD